MNAYYRKVLIAGILMLLYLATGLLYAQADLRKSLFLEADEVLKAAKNASADVLAPKSFDKGMEYYRDAEEDLQKGRNIEDIRKKIRAAISYFKMAIDATRLSSVSFSEVIKAREDALSADAPKYATKLWEEAEKIFKEAAEKLEKGDLNDAKKIGGEAEKVYRDAELEAIKANYLSETWTLIEKARKMKVQKKAPRTLEEAEALVKKAEKMLNENRYDTDEARDLAKKANYQVKHAIYLNSVIEKVEKEKTKYEDLFLSFELSLEKIASTLDMTLDFTRGFEEPTNTIVSKIETLLDSLESKDQQIADLNTNVNNLNQRIAELESMLGGIQKEQTELAKKMKAQEAVRQKFNELAQVFDKTEGKVLRDGNNIIIRLVGLNFDVGKSVIKPEHFGILTKVKNAIKLFEGAEVEIQGHTDSYGSDEANLKLSQERAEAVRAYLLANMEINPDLIKAVGYGENVPIANNETPEGRAKNRRIDVVIKPKL